MLTLRKDATSTQLLDYNSEGKKNYRSELYSPHLSPSSNFSGLARANSFFFFKKRSHQDVLVVLYLVSSMTFSP